MPPPQQVSAQVLALRLKNATRNLEFVQKCEYIRLYKAAQLVHQRQPNITQQQVGLLFDTWPFISKHPTAFEVLTTASTTKDDVETHWMGTRHEQIVDDPRITKRVKDRLLEKWQSRVIGKSKVELPDEPDKTSKTNPAIKDKPGKSSKPGKPGKSNKMDVTNILTGTSKQKNGKKLSKKALARRARRMKEETLPELTDQQLLLQMRMNS